MHIIPTDSWTLPSTQLFTTHIELAHRAIDAADPNMDVAYQPFDVKNMFTDLDKTYIKQALRFWFNHHTVAKYKSIYINKYNHRIISLDAPPSSTRYYHVPLRTLYDIMCFDLDESYFTLGSDTS